MKDQDLLNNIKIAAPCPASWNAMSGDDKIRFCGQCKLNVYNISSMTASEAANLIREKEGTACVKLLRRRDGTVITENCPVGLRRLRNAARRCAVAIVTIAYWLGLPAPAQPAEAQMMGGARAATFDCDVPAPLSPEALAQIKAEQERAEQAERARSSAWVLTIPALAAMLGMFLTRKQRNRSITKLGVVLVAVVGLSGLLWGLFVSGAFKF